ncbi:MAG: phosphate acyltransferase PlsX [Lachnospiraceae bacterium]|nr:phosphate acyltransferase PlsX [Lachnospiraceae bacterium]
MAETVCVVVDAMGGDNAPQEIVKGAVEAVNMNKDIHVILTGKQEPVEAELAKYTYDPEQITTVDCPEVIEMAEPPVAAIRTKKQSSLVVGMKMIRNKEADAIVSAGNTGALLVGGQTVVGRIKGVERTPTAPLIPTEKGIAILIDSGANVDPKPSYLVQYALMGSIYMEYVVGIKNPRVALLNIGAEEEKGNALVKATYPLLKELDGINFVGNIEARDIPHGLADVIVCDAFSGNIVLKLYEGAADTIIKAIKDGMMTNARSKLGGALVKPALKETLKAFDTSEYGGAPLLGCQGLVVKTHGSATANDIKNSVLQCVTFKQQGINDKIREHISRSDNQAEKENIDQ